MSSKRKKIDENQLSLDFSKAVDHFVSAKEQIEDAIVQREASRATHIECEFEASVEIAAGVKRALRESGISRDQLVDGINDYFGRTDESSKGANPTSRKPLSTAMMNHYLSKPVEYPLPAYMLLAVCAVLETLAPLETFVEPFGGRIATGIELQQMELGKLEQTLAEMQQIKRQMKKR